MGTLVGYERSNFVTKDGKEITGCNLYIAQKINPKDGNGMRVDRVYLTDAKIESSSLNLKDALNQEINISYNKWGKVAAIFLA